MIRRRTCPRVRGRRARVVPMTWWRIHAVVERARTDPDSATWLWHHDRDGVMFEARRVWDASMSHTDWMQEASMAWWIAVQAFRPGRGAPWFSFWRTTVRRRLASRLKAVHRHKHLVLSQAWSLQAPITPDADDRTTWEDWAADPRATDPVAWLVEQETWQERWMQWADALTPREWTVWLGWVHRRSYAAIAADMGLSVKSVDNALQRALRKIRAVERGRDIG